MRWETNNQAQIGVPHLVYRDGIPVEVTPLPRRRRTWYQRAWTYLQKDIRLVWRDIRNHFKGE